jgi:biopolymer transport protein ExbB
VSGELLSFPVLVRVTDAHLGVFAAADGADLHFLAADGGTLLEHEIERFDAARGELTAWVRVPSLKSGSDPALYLAYGDGHSHSANAGALWSDHQYVWHLTDDLSASNPLIVDSTGRAHATPSGAMSAANSLPGIAGQGLVFDGRDDQLVFENDLEGATPSTIQAWALQQPTQPGSYGSAILTLGEQVDNHARFLMSKADTGNIVKYGFYGNDLGSAAFAPEVWRHLVWTWDGSFSCLYINGSLVEGPTVHTGADTRGSSGRIGATTFEAPFYDYFMAGVLDEVRVSSLARSSAWVATEYANQRPDATFIKSIGDPEPARSE